MACAQLPDRRSRGIVLVSSRVIRNVKAGSCCFLSADDESMVPVKRSAQAINAQIVRFYSVDTEIAYFGIIGGVSILLGIILMLLSPKIQKFMKGVN